MGFVFPCNKNTENECFERMLFGAAEKFISEVSSIQKGEKGFLHNYETGVIYGIFKAIERGKNIEPRAWKGNYPAQLNVGWYARRGPVDARTLGIKNFIGKIILSDKEFNGIYSKFQSFRERLPPSFRADDGHYVRSEKRSHDR